MRKKISIKSLQAKITIYFILFTLLMINTVGWLLYFQTRKYFDEELGNKLKSAAEEITYLVQPDLLTYLVPGTEKGNFYQSLSLSLRGLKKSFNLKRVYIIDTTNKLLLDADTLKIIGSAIPHLQTNLVELSEAKNGKTISTTLYRSYNGNLYKSAFASIKNKNNKIIAVACVDASPSFLNVINKIEHFLFILNLISLITAILLSFLLARSITNPIKKLVSAAQRISGGNYNFDINITSRNEIGFLGNVFNAMQKNIRENESKLKELKQKAENEADNIKSYNELILQNVPTGILTIDLDGHLTVCNNEAKSLLNINSSGIIYKHYSDILNEEHPFRNIVDDVYKGKEFSALFEKELTLGEKVKTLSIKVAPLFDSNKKLIGSNWLLVDLSDIKELKIQVEEKKWLASLGELSAGIAHEIRNPLNSISLYLGLLKREIKANPEVIVRIEKIQTEIGNLNNIVADFLYFARPSKLILARVSISDLISESLFLAGEDISQKQIKVTTEFVPKDIFIICDKAQLKQALLNIVKNSIASMKDNGELNIKAYKYNGIIIKIIDNGQGIPPENLDKIFQPFFTTKRNGTGLGLAIVANIIKAHNGTISVHSKVNEGTSVTLNLIEDKK